jgi:uncharacterized membrane protein
MTRAIMLLIIMVNLQEEIAKKMNYILISILGIESGIKMGKILNYLLEKVLENSDLNTKEKLLAIVMKEWVKWLS